MLDKCEYLGISKNSVLDLSKAKSYKEAGKILLSKLDSSIVQKISYDKFINDIIPYYMNAIYSTKEGLSVKFKDWHISEAETFTEDYCLQNKKSLEVALMATAEVSIINEATKNNTKLNPYTVDVPMLLTKFPKPSSTGSLIINGVGKVLVSHLEPTNELKLDMIKAKAAKGAKELKLRTSSRIPSKKDGIIGATIGASIRMYVDKDGSILASVGNSGSYVVLSELKNYVNGALNDSVLSDIVGTSKEFSTELITFNDNTGARAVKKKGNSTIEFVDALSNFILKPTERQSLNRKLSLSLRTVGKKLYRDVKNIDGEVIAKAGEKVTDEVARYCQALGIDLYICSNKGFNYYKVISNGFCSIEDYYSYKLKLPADNIPDILKNTTISISEFENIKNNMEEISDINNLIQVNYHLLVGHTLSMDDFIAMTNMYGQFLSEELEPDETDSLACKGIVNICDIYEEEFSKYFPLRKTVYTATGSDRDTIIGMIKGRIALYKTSNMRKADSKFTGFDFSYVCEDNKTITSKMKTKSLINLEDTTNPAAQAAHRRKVSLLSADNRGGVTDTTADTEPRSVNPSFMGRLDPVESPEGAHIGLVRYMTTQSRINEMGLIEASFFKIDKDKREVDYKTCHYLDYSSEMKYVRAIGPVICDKSEVIINYYGRSNKILESSRFPVDYEEGTLKPLDGINYRAIAEKICTEKGYIDFEIKYNKKDWFENEKEISCVRGNGEFIVCDYKQVDIVTARYDHLYTYTTSTVPFILADDAARQMMAGHHVTQSIPIVGSDVAYTTTEITNSLTLASIGVKTSPVDGVVSYVDSSKMIITGFTGEEHIVDLVRNFRTVESTMLYSVPCVNVNDPVIKGQVICDNNVTKNGELALGANINVAYLSFYGLNFEDSAVFSDKVVKDDIMTSTHVQEFEIPIDTKNNAEGTIKKKERIYRKSDSELMKDTNEITDLGQNFSQLDEDGIIKVGEVIRPGDFLCAYLKIVSKGNNRNKIAGKYSIRPVIYQEFTPGIIVDTKITSVPDGEVITIKVARLEHIQAGDKISGRHGNKGVTSKVVPEYDMPYLPSGEAMDIILTPPGVPSRMNIGQLLEVATAPILKEFGLRVTVETAKKLDMNLLKEFIKIYPINGEIDADGNIKMSDKVQLYDGYTGLPYEQRTFVGIMHCYKSKHQVSHKIFARLGGRYNIYKQPPAGKKSEGGQALGAMENWSLAEMGAPALINELMTYKTDDVQNRLRYKNIMEESNGDYSEASSKLSVAQKNTPYVYKMIDSTLMSTLNRIVHYNDKGEEISINSDFMDKEGNIKQRSLKECVKLSRIKVHKALENFYNTGAIDEVQYEKYKLVPIDGYSEEEIKYGEKVEAIFSDKLSEEDDDLFSSDLFSYDNNDYEEDVEEGNEEFKVITNKHVVDNEELNKIAAMNKEQDKNESEEVEFEITDSDLDEELDGTILKQIKDSGEKSDFDDDIETDSDVDFIEATALEGYSNRVDNSEFEGVQEEVQEQEVSDNYDNPSEEDI